MSQRTRGIDAERASHKRYQRPKKPVGVALTPDDKRLFLELYRHGILDSRAVYRLFAERSVHVLRGRLRKLFHAGYILRLKQMRSLFVDGGGSRYEAYVLDTGAIEWLWDKHRLKPADRTRAFRERSAAYLLHNIELAHTVISIRQSVEARADIEFLYPHEIYKRWASDILRRDNLPISVRARVDWFRYRENASTIPDAFFMLFYPRREIGKQRRAVFLEIDMGTETIDPSDSKVRSLRFWKDTSVLRKFVVYAYAHKTGSYKEDFGVPTFQVLTITTNPEKVAKMQLAYRKRLSGVPHEVSPIRFLFTDFETLAKHSDILDAPIFDGYGRQFSLLP